MAVIRKTIDFLPSIFQSETNKKFLGSTLDQLISEPNLNRINGYIGRQFSPNGLVTENFVQEPDAERQYYQLEPSVVVRDSSDNIDFLSDYRDLINKINYYGGITSDHNRLFESEFYNYDPRIDFDKFINYSQYYWLPNGPDAVLVTGQSTTQANAFTFTSNLGIYTTNQTGNISNPRITVTRGDVYTFTVNHPGSNFYIQTEPGISGFEKLNPNESSRNILGVDNNGASVGDVVFTVPSIDAQNDLLSLNSDEVDYALSLTFTQLDGSAWTSNVTAYDGERIYPNNKLVIFTNNSTNSADWTDRNLNIIAESQRFGVWRMTVNTSNQIELSYVRSINTNSRVYVKNGDTYGGRYYIKSAANVFTISSTITAPLQTLYYQNSANPLQYGQIDIIEGYADVVDVTTEIIGRKFYTAPNGVEFVNGLKIVFDDTITPSSYINKTYIVEGVGTGIRLIDFDLLVAPEVETDLESVPFDTVNFDIGNFDETFRGSAIPDYLTISRASRDLNAWTRSNRWFHVDIINLVADYNNVPPSIDQTKRAQRPIIEFIPDLLLYKSGRRGIGSVDQFFDNTDVIKVNGELVSLNDAFTQINNQTTTNLKSKGIDISVGQKVVFGADLNQAVRQKIYQVSGVNQKTATNFDGQVAGNVEIKFGSDKITALDLTINFTNLTTGTEIYLSNNTYVGQVLRVINEFELLLTTTLSQNYNIVSGIKYNFPRVALTELATAAQHDSIVVTGGKNIKQTYIWSLTGTATYNWIAGQLKTKVNQEPLFDIINTNDQSFSSAYINSTFAGSKLFSYLRSSGIDDYILGFPLSYNNSTSSIGDLRFDNNYITDTFTYTVSTTNLNKITEKVSTGFIGQIAANGVTINKLGFLNKSIESSRQSKHITAEFDGTTNYFEIGVTPRTSTVARPTIRVYINNVLLERSALYSDLVSGTLPAITTTVTGTNAEKYGALITGFYKKYLGRNPDQTGLDFWTGLAVSNILNVWEVEKEIGGSNEANMLSSGYDYRLVGVRKCIVVSTSLLSVGDRVDIFVETDDISDIGFFTIPSNLEKNPQNEDVAYITMGQMRSHVYELGQNNRLIGNIFGASNLRNLDIKNLTGTILQQSAPLTLTGLFTNGTDINFYDSIDFARREYTRFKNKFLELAQSGNYVNLQDIPGSVDLLVSKINEVKNSSFPFFYSDMLPIGENFVSIKHTVINPLTVTYNTSRSYSGLTSGNSAALIYLNNNLLIKDRDYTFNTSPTVTLLVTLAAQDVIEIREYLNTDGSYVPETPTKLGLYPKFIPVKFLDNTYRTPTYVIQGHDGSLTVSFGDYRDDLLLEFEKRIYNNLKVDYNSDMFDIDRYIPGRFRSTEYTLDEFNTVLNTEFIKYLGTNQVDYTSNSWFVSNDEFTWNYSQAQGTDQKNLTGYWRGIYRYYFDTDRPHTHPWEMMGYRIKPTWWDTYYSWTNTIKRSALILSITNGYIYNPGGSSASVAVKSYARSGFAGVVPVDKDGNLLSPMRVMVRAFNHNYASQDFAVGQQGPVESAWRRSSEFPFALSRTLSLLKPGRYFGLLFDTANYKYTASGTVSQHYLLNSNRRPNTKLITINGYENNGITARSTGYINWIFSYLTGLGLGAGTLLRHYLDDLEVNLSYKMAGFTDKKYINVLAEQFTPSSTNETIILPDENYIIHLNKSVPLAKAVYTAVIIERTGIGYKVTGYDQNYPYFTIIPSETNGSSSVVNVLGSEVRIFEDFSFEKLTVPYGYQFTTKQQVVDFLQGLQRYQQAQGFLFDQFDVDLGYNKDWTLSAREFLTWAKQGWGAGNIIVLSPVNDTLRLFNEEAVVDHITNKVNESQILGVNFNVIRNTEFNVVRDGTLTTVNTVSGQTITFAELNLVQFEHVLVVENTTVFNDIVYNPQSGNRQSRLKLIGSKTADWDGQLTPYGFIYNSGTITIWAQGQDYKRGDIVEYKNKKYTAMKDISASDTFVFSNWSLLDFEVITGLIPNFSYNAAKLVNIYDIDNQPLDESFAKFSTGLIGFRSRNFLEDLGMTPTTQSKFYQGYIKQKGTKNSLEALSRGKFGIATTEVELHEEWAARVGEYGAIDSNPSIKISLDQNKFKENPAAIELLTFNGLPSSELAVGIKEIDLLSRPIGYTPNIFLNRNQQQEFTFKIELFGDGVMCGKDSSLTVPPLYQVCRYNKSTGRVTSPPDYLLYSQLRSRFPVAITTRSVEGTTSGELLTGLDGVNGDWPNDVEAEIVVINHGIEDARRGISLETYRSNLRNLRLRLPETVIVIWQTPTQVDMAKTASWVGSTEYPSGTNNVGAYATVMREVAAEFDDFLSDAYTIENWTGYLGADGVYPNQNGYFVLVQTRLQYAVADAIRYYMRSRVKLYDNDVKSAGYVNKNDVDNLIFDIADLTSIDSTITSELITDYKIWTAKNFDQDWQVYRAYQIQGNVTEIASDVDTRIRITVDQNHGVEAGDIIALQNTLPELDGFYQALVIDNANIIVNTTEAISSSLKYFTFTSNSGIIFDFQPLRFQNLESFSTATPKHGWRVEDLVFVDDIGDQNISWAVLKRPELGVEYNTTVSHANAAAYSSTIKSYYLNNLYRNADQGGLDFWTGLAVNNILSLQQIETEIKNSDEGRRLGFVNHRVQDYKVDIDSVNNIYLYSNKQQKILSRVDIIDPAKGRLLGFAQADLDYTSSADPARYNAGSNPDDLAQDSSTFWGTEHVGRYWWNIDVCRYIDYEQDSLDYRINNWGSLFPGSSIHVYEWIESDVLPSQYADSGQEGTVLYAGDTYYSQRYIIDPETMVAKLKYYYWVRDRRTATNPAKSNSVYSIASAIVNPISQGMAYAALLKNNSIALYNIGSYISGADTVLHIGYQTTKTENVIHSEFELIAEGTVDGVIPPRIERKIIDSLVGADSDNNLVPDPNLNNLDKLGLGLRPRQTVIIDRIGALRNVFGYINSILLKYPAASRLINNGNIFSDNFYAIEPLPTTGFDLTVETYSALPSVPSANQRVLVKTDETQGNYWTIYRRDASNVSWTFTRRQSFDVTKHWEFIDYFLDGFSDKTKPTYIVKQYKDIYQLTLNVNDIVKVMNVTTVTSVGSYTTSTETAGDYELYQAYSENGTMKLRLIGLQNGTFRIKDNMFAPIGFDSSNYDTDLFDANYFTELRYIFAGIKQDVFINDLALNYNLLMFFVIEKILAEQNYVDWFFKTSFITLFNRVQGLIQLPNYVPDRKDLYESYVNEVKPYRTKIRNFVSSYTETETPRVAITDFDLPGYYDANLSVYRSPNGEISSDQAKLQLPQYKDWYDYYKYSVNSIEIAQKGYGYKIDDPTVIIARTDTASNVNAQARITLTSIKNIDKVYIDESGSNYTQTPIVTVSGTGGTRYSDSKPYDFRVVSRGSNYSGANAATGIYSITTGNLIANNSGTGYTVHALRRSDGELVFSRTYNLEIQNTPGYTGFTDTDMTNDMNQYDNNYVLVVHTTGDPSINRLNVQLQNAIYRIGGSPQLFGSATNFLANAAYVLVGIPGAGTNSGLENYSGTANSAVTAWTSVDFRLKNGYLIPLAAIPKYPALATPVSFPLTPSTNQAYSYGSKTWVYTGTRWRLATGAVKSSLPGDQVPRTAKLVPRLYNGTVRKLQTVIRFDRIKYDTQVYDWEAGGFDSDRNDQTAFDPSYPEGTYLSYLGQGYVTTSEMLGGPRFVFANVKLLGSDQPIGSRTYLNGFFDNANDRIMSYYQPTAGMIPKDLTQLVPGIESPPLVEGNYAVTGDTILLGDTFGSTAGISSGNIRVTGGTFISNIFSHAPEELLPGLTYDTFNIRVAVNVAMATGNLITTYPNYSPTSFGMFGNVLGTIEYYEVANYTTTTLAQDLNLTDGNIVVADGAVLSTPNPATVTPGVIYVNGERIQYYVKNGNTLSQIRRGLDITGTPAKHLSGSTVYDVGYGAISINVKQ